MSRPRSASKPSASTVYPGLTLRVLGAQTPAMGPGKAALLEAIVRSGSISAAGRELGMSYRRAWQLADALNRSFRQPVVARAVGGSRGGGASVTPYGLQLLAEFRAMELRASQAIAVELKAFRRKLSSDA